MIGASSIVDEIDSISASISTSGWLATSRVRIELPLSFCMGDGPVVVYQDMTAHYSRKMNNRLVAIARDRGIPVQQAIYQNYGSDAASLLKRGVEVSLIAYPTRYTHSPIETVDENAISNTASISSSRLQRLKTRHILTRTWLVGESLVPRKLRELRSDLRRAGWIRVRQTGSHQTWQHPDSPGMRLTLSGSDGDDAKPYQERAVQGAVAHLRKESSDE